MEENKKKAKKLGYILGIVAFIALAAGATYAWLTWRSNNILIAGSSECFDVVYYKKDLGTAQNPAKIKFQESYVGALDYAEVGLSIDPNCATVAGKGSIYLTTNAQGTTNNILTGGLYYTLVSVTNNVESFIKEGPITSTGDILLENNIFVNSSSTGTRYRVYVWINGPLEDGNGNYVADNTYVGGTYAGEIRAEVASSEATETAATYITNLYTNATKSTATVNSITYNLAPSVGLMNDRLGGTTQSLDGGNIRYYGANPNNYVWLGDTYTADYTIPGGITLGEYADQEECISEEGSEVYCTEDIVRHAGDKKLWRVIGVFDGRVKLVTADPISTQGLSWDTSANASGGNNGSGINQWGPSESYEGADLMRLLNPGYENASINNSLYWNKSAGTVYTEENNATTANVSFANTGLSASEKALIDTAIWYTGAYSGNISYVDAQYAAERGNMGKICTQNNFWCNDTVTRTSTWSGKVGLIYGSDYGYAANSAQCNQTMDNYEDGCWNNNWLRPSSYVNWTMSPRAYSSSARSVFYVGYDGYFNDYGASSGFWVWPAIYLKPGVTIASGSGTFADPYVIN